jgi:hypothetical protein
VTRAKAAGLKCDLGSAATDAGEVLDERQESLVRRDPGLALGHELIVHE